MPRGGKRPNAGRKLSPETVAFRDFWRAWFESEEGRRHLIARAKKSDAILAKLMDKCFPSPKSVDLSGDNKPIVVMFGSGAEEHKRMMDSLQYKPMGQVPGMKS
jgi:hypothetical protein